AVEAAWLLASEPDAAKRGARGQPAQDEVAGVFGEVRRDDGRIVAEDVRSGRRSHRRGLPRPERQQDGAGRIGFGGENGRGDGSDEARERSHPATVLALSSAALIPDSPPCHFSFTWHILLSARVHCGRSSFFG